MICATCAPCALRPLLCERRLPRIPCELHPLAYPLQVYKQQRVRAVLENVGARRIFNGTLDSARHGDTGDIFGIVNLCVRCALLRAPPRPRLLAMRCAVAAGRRASRAEAPRIAGGKGPVLVLLARSLKFPLPASRRAFYVCELLRVRGRSRTDLTAE